MEEEKNFNLSEHQVMHGAYYPKPAVQEFITLLKDFVDIKEIKQYIDDLSGEKFK